MDDKAKLANRVKALRNVRRAQTGQRAAATQRKLEAAVAAALDAGVAPEEMDK